MTRDCGSKWEASVSALFSNDASLDLRGLQSVSVVLRLLTMIGMESWFYLRARTGTKKSADPRDGAFLIALLI